MELWEILVPTERGNGRFYTIRYHKIWDGKVRAISGGLTILHPVKGNWISGAGELFVERMIPVRIACSREQIQKIMDITLNYYNQLAVLAYKVSDECLIKHRDKKDK